MASVTICKLDTEEKLVKERKSSLLRDRRATKREKRTNKLAYPVYETEQTLITWLK